MSVTVTLHIFSGRPDPSWELSENQVEELVDRLSRIDQRTFLKPPGIVGGLGYRGFSIEAVREKNLDPHLYIHSGIIDLNRFDLNRMTDNTDLEEWLLATSGINIDTNIKQFLESDLGGSIKKSIEESQKSNLMFASPPPYNPGKWNNDPDIRSKNNCYNYANDKITGTFAQPGRGSGQTATALDCSNVGAAATRDGQVSVSSASTTPSQGHFIALVIWPGKDYHWYRLDANAMWSHKPGQTPGRNTDNSGNAISDPRSCDRGPYSAWCGFYHCIPANVRIQ